ncbi:MAG TPA: hypothetical protein VFO41_08760 [Alphaproteobacteria bacterium]|nr:hypothetical protein [Alphaproteobacteria bacterium]
MMAPIRNPDLDIVLTDEERASGAWRALKAKFEAILDRKRKENDNPNLTDVETATLRGHIACLKAVLALDKPPLAAVPDARSQRA